MPQYTFECTACDVRFTRTLKMDNHLSHPCPNCKEIASRLIEGFSFNFEVPKTASIANTGVHDHDYPTADKAVGRSADQKWAEMDVRNKIKGEARRQGNTHALIRHTGKDYIDYEPMTPIGQKARKDMAKDFLSLRKPRNP